VDALCIIQDDESLKLEQISQMDRIYLSAVLSIVAGDGQNANAGLSGFNPGSRHSKQTVESVGGLRFVSMSPPISHVLEGLKWHSRGWTYQEFMLSKRMLIFTEQQVFYGCSRRNFAEDSYRPSLSCTYVSKSKAGMMESNPGENLDDFDHRYRLNRRNFHYEQNWHAYKILVEDYTIRNMTHQADVVKALAGILRAMISSRAEKYICGIPSSMLEWGLLWQPQGPLIRRGTSSTGKLFPSWSWVGWIGPVKYVDYPGPEATKILIKDWLLLTYSLQHQAQPKNRSLGGIFRNRCVKPQPPPEPDSAEHRDLLTYQPHVISTAPIWEQTIWASWKTDPTLAMNIEVQQDRATYIERVCQHQLAMDEKGPLIESGLLSFTASSAIFSVVAGPLKEGYRDFPQSSTGSFRIVDNSDTWVGSIHLELGFAATFGPHCEAEFIALSRTHVSYEATNSLNVGQNSFDTSVLRELDQPAHAPLLLNVMWITWEGGVAFRVGVGQIHVHAWARANPTSKRIVLG
jgi:hypothetical protein